MLQNCPDTKSLQCRHVAFAILLLLTAGCATFPSGQLPVVEEIAIPPGPKPSLNVSYDLKVTDDGTPQLLGLTDLLHERGWKKVFFAELVNTGAFSRVGENLPEADINLDVTMQLSNRGNSFLAFMCGYTSFLVPAFWTNNYLLDATVFINNSGESHQIHVEDFNTNWIHLGMIPFMPFNMLPGKAIETEKSIYRNLVNELAEDGILAAARPTHRREDQALSQQAAPNQTTAWNRRFNQVEGR